MDGSSWNKKSIISVFILFFAGLVVFTVFGLNWPQYWQVLDLYHVTKSKLSIFELNQAIHGGNNLTCK